MSKMWQNWLTKRFQYSATKKLTQKEILVFIYKSGYVYVLLIFISFMAGINYANNLILGFCFLISAVLCVSFYLTFKQLHGLSIELVSDEVGQVGQVAYLTVYFIQPTVQQRYLYIKTDEQIQRLHLLEKKQKISIAFRPEKRGEFLYPMLQIYTLYPFGLVRAWSYLYHQKKAWIAPTAQYLTHENQHHQADLIAEFDEFRELRSFQQQDSLHSVAWKQVARGQGMYVKVFEQAQEQAELDIYYHEMPSSSHETKLALMMGLVEQCEQQQRAYRLCLSHAELPKGCGAQQLQSAKRLLAQA